VCAVVFVGLAAPSAGARLAAGPRTVSATIVGVGGYTSGCNGTRTSQGRLAGSGYSLNACMTFNGSSMTLTGSFTLSNSSGAHFDGAVSGTWDGEAEIVHVRVLGGTGRFAHARGHLTIGPIIRTHETGCDPTHTVCASWKDRGPMTGTLKNVGS
jgi:hypothetical protein